GDVTFTKAKLEKDDGVRKYEIEFRKGGTEYEYEIDAATGAILECDVGREDEPARPAEPSHNDDDDDRYDDDHDDDDDDDRYDDDDDDDDDDRYDDDDDDD
ncbi:MAG: PepSY domain-containing protein, partial [Eubacteriales bacterium]|nr:PepSY domain-containing protein [Eubacteriales bacterium]